MHTKYGISYRSSWLGLASEGFDHRQHPGWYLYADLWSAVVDIGMYVVTKCHEGLELFEIAMDFL
jgi:hypothetical protein